MGENVPLHSGQFSISLTHRRVYAGQDVGLEIHNLSSGSDTYILTFQGIDVEVDFVPSMPDGISLMAGETRMVDFAVSPRTLNWFGKSEISRYSVTAQSACGSIHQVIGEVANRSLIPTWLISILVMLCIFLACGTSAVWKWNQNRLTWVRETRRAQFATFEVQTATADFLSTKSVDVMATPMTASPTVLVTEAMHLTPEPSEMPGSILIHPTFSAATTPIPGGQSCFIPSEREGMPLFYLLQSGDG